MGNIPAKQFLNCISIESFGAVALDLDDDKDTLTVLKTKFDIDKVGNLENYDVFDFYKDKDLYIVECRRVK